MMEPSMMSTDMEAESLNDNQFAVAFHQVKPGHTAVRNGHNIIVAGGCDVTRNVQKCYNDVWKLDTTRLRWTLLSGSHPRFGARELHTAHLTSGGRILLIGGQKMLARDYQDVVMFKSDSCGGTPSCSGNGTCINGSCSCNSGWASQDCGEAKHATLGCYALVPDSEGTATEMELVSQTGCANARTACDIPTELSSRVTGRKDEKQEKHLSQLPNLYAKHQMGGGPPVGRYSTLCHPGIPAAIDALRADIPGMPRTNMPVSETKMQPPHTSMRSQRLPTPLPDLPPYGAATAYVSAATKVVVGVLSLLGGSAAVSVIYAINHGRT
ncbi:EGF family domain-containing protein [Besnoitia besnoiti]|uniref:EGF family domain-containing protein n=1 Tax=Besnoitia besnoiti TaxID=94643 RepID=A0A2A9MA44_BESBE|nr:EGF family domain-containing protein [Besnoitia besnoiti]PFH32806.1 EGF family domain-containing protein [Besnoitia besnoiti]